MLGKGTKRHMPTKQVQAQKTKHKPTQALGARDSELLLTYLSVSTVQWLLEV